VNLDEKTQESNQRIQTTKAVDYSMHLLVMVLPISEKKTTCLACVEKTPCGLLVNFNVILVNVTASSTM